MSECKYFIPGPVWVRPEILQEMTRPMIGHRSREFRELMEGVFPRLKTLFGTEQHAFVATASGTGLMEAAILNTVQRSVLVTTCGAFSERWLRIAQQLGVEADPLEHEWGQPIDPVRLGNHLAGRHHHYDAVTITHNETSTGVVNDVAALAAVVREHSKDTLILVDSVSALGSMPVQFDEWGVDICLASSQKGLAIPPGIAVFAVSERAVAQSEKERYKGMYFDLLQFVKAAAEGSVPYTPSIPHVYALGRQLREMIEVETLEKRYERHRRMRELTREMTIGFADPLPPPEAQSPSVTTLRLRSGSAPALVQRMRGRGYTIASGYGRMKDETFRIGHMGDVSLDDLRAMLEVLAEEASRTDAVEG